MSWQMFFDDQRNLGYMRFLEKRLNRIIEIEKKIVYPKKVDIYKAFDLVSPEKVRVVILGQDPYINEGEAQGLAFSVPKGFVLPPSLKNIFKEIKDDVGIENTVGDLTSWAKQGVFLLNAILTVEAGKSASHTGLGWDTFTDNAIKYISEKQEHVVFILWGKKAQEVDVLINHKKHYVIKSPHPSPFSADLGFFGSKPFSETNTKLVEWGYQPIDWEVK